MFMQMFRGKNCLTGKMTAGAEMSASYAETHRLWLETALVVLLLVVFPAALRAQFLFVTNNGTISITGYTGAGGAVTIPGSTNGLPVTAIATHAFYQKSTLVSLTIPSSVTNYAVYAVDSCPNLLAVYFQGNGPGALSGGAPPPFNNIPKVTFYYLPGASGFFATYGDYPVVKWNPQILTQLNYMTIAGQIQITGYSGAGGAVAIPSTIDAFPVGSLSSNAFLNCSSLTEITLPNTVTGIGARAFANCTNLTSIIIPKSVAGSGVFSGCSALTNVVIHTNITKIAESEFSGCTALKSIIIPASITNLGPWAFQNCTNLKAVYFQSNAPSADLTVFEGANSVTNYFFPKAAGWGDSLSGRPTVPILFTVTTNAGSLTISRYIGLEGLVTIPSTYYDLPVTGIGNSAFYQGNTVTNISIGANITSIAGQAFVNCSNLLTISVDALNSNYSSVDGVLFNKNQTLLLYYPGGRTGSYVIPNSVLTVWNYAFQGAYNLTSVYIPATVTAIKSLAFNNDPKLTAIYFQGNAPTPESFAFSIPNTVAFFYLPTMSGWGASFAGFTTALWRPQVQSSDGNFGVRSNQFGFNITWANGMSIVVEACGNPGNSNWIPLTTNLFSGDVLYFADPDWTNFTGRLYRVRSQ